MTYHLGPIDPDRRAELFADTRDEEPHRPRRVLATALALLVMALFGGGLWFAYMQGSRHTGGDAASGGVPLIRADERPTKVKPEKPGGMEIPDRDKLIYNPIRPTVEHLLPPPEKPMPRPAPSPNSPPHTASPPATAAPPAAASTPANPPAGPPAPATRTQQPTAAALAKAPLQQPAQAKPATAGGTRLQLGSVRSEDAARQEWERIKRKNADLLGALSVAPVRADLGEKGVYYRIQTGPVADPAAAERICSELKQRNIGCIIAR